MNINPTPDALAEGETLARKFHEIYERLAPSFGYETRDETKAFSPDSANGRLMIAVCGEILADSLEAFHAKPSAGELPTGMLPWEGGDTAPDDYQGGLVMFRDGDTAMGERDPWDWSHGHLSADIIAYMPGAALQSPPPVVSREAEIAKAIAMGHALDAEDGGYPAPPVVEEGRREAAQQLQDHMEQFHGVCLSASEWDAAILALTPIEGMGEPVAWRWEGIGRSGHWERRITAYKPCGASDVHCRNVEPLYLSTPATAQGDVREALTEARFLCDRLDELDFSLDMEEFTRLHIGHVDPSHSRLKGFLATLKGQDNV